MFSIGNGAILLKKYTIKIRNVYNVFMCINPYKNKSDTPRESQHKDHKQETTLCFRHGEQSEMENGRSQRCD